MARKKKQENAEGAGEETRAQAGATQRQGDNFPFYQNFQQFGYDREKVKPYRNKPLDEEVEATIAFVISVRGKTCYRGDKVTVDVRELMYLGRRGYIQELLTDEQISLMNGEKPEANSNDAEE